MSLDLHLPRFQVAFQPPFRCLRFGTIGDALNNSKSKKGFGIGHVVPGRFSQRRVQKVSKGKPGGSTGKLEAEASDGISHPRPPHWKKCGPFHTFACANIRLACLPKKATTGLFKDPAGSNSANSWPKGLRLTGHKQPNKATTIGPVWEEVSDPPTRTALEDQMQGLPHAGDQVRFD